MRIFPTVLHGWIAVRIARTGAVFELIAAVVGGVAFANAEGVSVAVEIVTVFVFVTVAVVVTTNHTVGALLLMTFAGAIVVAGFAALAITAIVFIRIAIAVVVAIFSVARAIECAGKIITRLAAGKFAIAGFGAKLIGAAWCASLGGIAIDTFEDKTGAIHAFVVGTIRT